MVLAWNEITLNSTAITDLQSVYEAGERFKVVYVGGKDYDNSEPALPSYNLHAWYGIGDGDSDNHPYLEITYTGGPISNGKVTLASGKIILSSGKLKL